MGLAGVLGFFFGPIGMLYAGVKAALAALVAGSAVFVLTLAIALGATNAADAFLLAVLEVLMVGPVCSAWAACAVAWRNRNLPPSLPH